MDKAAPSWVTFTVKSRMAMGRDFDVSDADTGEVRYAIDGKMGMRPSAEIREPSGCIAYNLRGSLMGIPKTMKITDSAGALVGSLKAKFFSPIKAEMSLETEDGRSWHLLGSFLEREYEVTVDDQPAIRIRQRVLNVRDTFTMEVADGVDPGLAAGIMWAVDRFVEQS